MRLRLLIAVVLGAVLFLGCGMAFSGDVYVIAHPDLKLDPQDIREVFLGDKEFSGNLRIVPVDNRAVQAEFLSKAMAMDLVRYNNIWIKKGFRDAINPPVAKSTDREVLEFVKRTRGALGYVANPSGNGVVIVKKYQND